MARAKRGKRRAQPGPVPQPVAAPAGGRVAAFDVHFIDDLRWWVVTDPRTAARVLQLMEAVLRDPFQGIGKPEPLRQVDPDTWSRRITQEHRLVYRVAGQQVHFLQARYHYEN